ncbi:MAG: YitT family protein [Clostridia bacterium]|nr:YitT family protein [Clostridia bacterium]
MKTNVKKSIEEKKRAIKVRKTFDFIRDFLIIAIGAYLISLSINMFLLPHKMTTGGASGIATVLYYMFHMPMGITILIINIPLFIIALLKLGKKFAIKTIIATVLLSVFLEVFQYEQVIKTTQIDLLMSCIFGGIISGIGLSLVFKAGASSGGSDLLANIIYQLTKSQSISKVLMAIEVVIIGSVIICFKNLNLGLYSIIALVISTKVIDIIFDGIYNTKVATIITKKGDVIADSILKELERGATITNSIGAHSGEENTTITCVITRNQIASLKQIIRDNDNRAMMYITNANEAIGRGFKSID